MKKVAYIRADASPAMGGGHIMRCLALAEALTAMGDWEARFLVRPETPISFPALKRYSHAVTELLCPPEDEAREIGETLPGCDTLVVDHYGLGADFEKASRAFAREILAIDDVPKRVHACDALLDAGAGSSADAYATFVSGQTRLLLGPSYALLRPEFQCLREGALAKRSVAAPVQRILLSFGAMDNKNFCVKSLRALVLCGLEVKTDIILSARAPHLGEVQKLADEMPFPVAIHTDTPRMASLMLAADLAIGAGGGSALERCCLGLASIIVLTADNQSGCQALHDRGAALVAGWHEQVDAAGLARLLAPLAADASLREAMSARAFDVCDGRGAQRVAACFGTFRDRSSA
jgi:UDP-2,4-diacetamido-2,4,6-trideoxy-beta-L-altropyranose hydrolase